MKIILLILIGIVSMSYANESYYKNGELVELQNIYSSKNVNNSSITYYKTLSGKKIGVTNQLLLQCKESVDCIKLLDTFNLSNYSKLSDTIFIVTITNSNNIFSVSKALFESKKVVFAHPNFIKKKKKR